MAKITTDMATDLRKKITEKKIVIGLKETQKKLLDKQLEKVILAKNCSQEMKEDFEKKCNMAGVKCEIVEFTNEELGVLCRKQYSASVLGVLK